MPIQLQHTMYNLIQMQNDNVVHLVIRTQEAITDKESSNTSTATDTNQNQFELNDLIHLLSTIHVIQRRNRQFTFQDNANRMLLTIEQLKAITYDPNRCYKAFHQNIPILESMCNSIETKFNSTLTFSFVLNQCCQIGTWIDARDTINQWVME